MKMLGLGIAVAGAVVALVAWFGFSNTPFSIGGSVFLAIGILTMKYGPSD